MSAQVWNTEKSFVKEVKLKYDKIINWENFEHDFLNAKLPKKSEIKQEIYHENAETTCYLLLEMKSGMPD